MADIYDQHQAAFSRVSAYVVLRNGERVATIAFKFPEDGAGRLYAYVHWLGTEMSRGFASGGGYDKRTAACASATARKSVARPAMEVDTLKAYCGFWHALMQDRGPTWDRALEDAGFTVLQAV